jgi:hypothetical protein
MTPKKMALKTERIHVSAGEHGDDRSGSPFGAMRHQEAAPAKTAAASTGQHVSFAAFEKLRPSPDLIPQVAVFSIPEARNRVSFPATRNQDLTAFRRSLFLWLAPEQLRAANQGRE